MTNRFAFGANGPARFAQRLLRINDASTGVHLDLLTEDAPEGPETPPHVYPLRLRLTRAQRLVGKLARSRIYAERAADLHERHAYDIVVYNNATNAVAAADRLAVPVLGMINDVNHLNASLGAPTSYGVLRSKILVRTELEACRRLSAVIVNSDYLRERLRGRLGGRPHAPIERLYKGIELPLDELPAARPLGECVRVAFVKTDWRRGGLPVLLAALGRSSHSYELAIASGRPDEIEDYLAGVSVPANVRVDLRGKLDRAGIAQLLEESDMFCVPAHSEALGVASMEAMARGVPCVGTRVEGVPEVYDQGRAGLLCPPDDPDALAAALGACIADPVARERRRAHAFTHVRTKFNLQGMLDRFTDICRTYAKPVAA